MADTMKMTDWKAAALAAETLANRVYDNAVRLTYWAVAQVGEQRRMAEDCAARNDYVGAWIAYGKAYLVIEDDQKFSLLKKDANGQII